MLHRILIEVGHPAQVHQFRIIAKKLLQNSNQVLFVAKKKEITITLLQIYDLPYEIIDDSKKGIVSKVLHIPKVYLNFYRIVKKFKPNIILSRFSLQSSHIAKLLNIPHIGFTDSEHVKLMDSLTVPFVNYKFTAFSYYKDLGKNHFRYPSNIELFYLHPKWFVPDKSVLEFLGVKEEEKYVILRFVSFDAHHDVGQTGIMFEEKEKLVEALSKYARVFISSEKPLPEVLAKYQIQIPLEKMHDAMAFAYLYVGEGGTMASECAMLGTPNVLINSLAKLCGVHNDLTKNHKVQLYYDTLSEAYQPILDLVKNENTKIEWEKRRQLFLSKMIDASSFIVWVIENYPKSIEILKNNPDYYNNFK
ncbi:MAG: DUF354 domain-containing protein [Bacteroidales bacterium]|nr:DUF354 domain-containing protein [Bacteroidales bacterium]MCF8402549.1 DUF354 domain-containing protein [Bacteroidales bacterium]